LNGALPVAMATYEEALQKTPGDFELNRAAGRLASTLKNYDAAIRWLSQAQAQVSNDPETQYYLGLAYIGTGDDVHARPEFEGAQRQPQLRAAARMQLAMLDAREGRFETALDRMQAAMSVQPDMVRAGTLEVALLRHLGKADDARERASSWIREDPTNSFLRYERVLLGGSDPALDRHLASDPERVLEIAVDYLNLGLYQDALKLLSRSYPQGNPLESEPGLPLPQDYALVRYYRGFCLEMLGRSPGEEYRAGSRMSTRYVFPYRPTDLAVLRAALRRNPDDAVAHYYLGNLLLSATMTDAAIAEWQKARSLDPKIPVLHRNLGRTLLALKRDDAAALDAFKEGIQTDRTNVELYTGLDQAMSILGRPASERAAALERYPDLAKMPTPLALELALTYAEAGRFDDAERMFHNRYFEREEGGANVREVYIETRLMRALALARAGHRPEARTVLANLGAPVEGLDFTRDGMEPFLANARVQYLQGEIEKRIGDDAAARASWTRAKARRGIFAALASRELGDAGWKDLAGPYAATGHGGPPAERGVALMALGRNAEAKQAVDEVLRRPERNLSHFFARQALAAGD
jgi:tetratricopeptide (TPR) repeat protein